jgi:starch-binding outer membrane protein, SusD/RagB family
MRIKFIFISIVIILTGCSEEFLNRPPNARITGGVFPANQEDAINALNAAYSSLRAWQYNCGGFPLLDILADDGTKGSNPGDAANLNLYNTFDHDATDENPRRWWASLYQAVRTANLVIESVPELEEIDPELQERILAEARFLRGFHYSILVRAFGDVVVVTRSGVDYNDKKGRTPAMEVWNEVIFPDLKYASERLPLRSEYPPEDLGRATKGAAHALLARMYLFVGDYVNAEINALAVINSQEYALETTFADAFSEEIVFGPEAVFEIGAIASMDASEGGNQWAQTQGVRGDPNRGWGFNRPSYEFMKRFDEDPRLDASVIFLGEVLDGFPIIGDDATPDTIYDINGNIIEIECYNQKTWTPNEEDVTSRGVNRKIVRYSDVLLMAAEALNENGKSGQALSYLNEVRARARGDNSSVLPDITTTNQSELRDIIFEERGRELAFEGLRFWDIIRTGRAVEILGPLGFQEGKHELFPIPLSEIDNSNGAIEQNPYYN